MARSPVHTVAMKMQGSATAQRTRAIRSGSFFAMNARIGQSTRAIRPEHESDQELAELDA